MNRADVGDIESFELAAHELCRVNKEVRECCDAGIRSAENLYLKTQGELDRSKELLTGAKMEEAGKLALYEKAQAEYIQALYEQSCAVGSGNPVLIAAAAAKVANATCELEKTKDEYQQAKEHRERLETRQELAQECVKLAQKNLEMLTSCYPYGRDRINELVESGCRRLQAAYDDLKAYLECISPAERRSIQDYQRWEPGKKRPVNPKEIHDRLNPDDAVIDYILSYLYATDPNFQKSINRLCAQMDTSENIAAVEIKIKKYIVGRLCEELVNQAFLPIGEKIVLQHVCYLDNGRFTKVDMILYGLKEPVILGRGENMGGKKGGSLAIEVKSGKAEYIYSQIAHMETQAEGHKSCDISCTVCTRDIRDLSPEQREEIKKRLKEAGSPILGMLPRKSVMDDRCIRFVRGKAEKKYV